MTRTASKAAPTEAAEDPMARELAATAAMKRHTRSGAKAPATKQAPAKASAKAGKPAPTTKAEVRTTCQYREGGWAEANGFRALVAAPFACSRPKAKGKNMCEQHEKEYVAAAKKRRALRDQAGESAPRTPKSAGTSRALVGAAPAKARKPARNSGGAPRKSTPPVRPMGSGPVASTAAGKAALTASA